MRLQPATRALLKPSRTKSPTSNELRTIDRCGNSTTQSQAPDDGYMNVRNILHPSLFYYIPLYRTDMEQVNNIMQCIKTYCYIIHNNHENQYNIDMIQV